MDNPPDSQLLEVIEDDPYSTLLDMLEWLRGCYERAESDSLRMSLLAHMGDIIRPLGSVWCEGFRAALHNEGPSEQGGTDWPGLDALEKAVREVRLHKNQPPEDGEDAEEDGR